MKGEERKAALAAYKQRKVAAGIYAIRCVLSGQRWVGRARDFSNVQNRLWFTLRQGIHPSRSLQAAWAQHGSGGLIFAELERLGEAALLHNREGALRERLAHWSTELEAEAI
jgi:hypothetical protein